MNTNMYREYIFKFYLNANHYIVINGVQGEIHPHTWEFTVDIMMDNKNFVQFNQYEKAIDAYLETYQNKVMNEFEPFNKITPTLENIAEHFIVDFKDIIQSLGGRLVKLEASETPTRTYVLSFESDEEFISNIKKDRHNKADEIMDFVLDGILGNEKSK